MAQPIITTIQPALLAKSWFSKTLQLSLLMRIASCSTCSTRVPYGNLMLTSPARPQTYDVGGRQCSESIRSHGNTSAGFGYSSCALPARYLFMSRVVEWLKPSLSVTLRCFVRHVWTVVRTCSHGTYIMTPELTIGR